MQQVEAREGSVLTVSELHTNVLAALDNAGLDRVWVTGVVAGLRRGPRFSSWELVEYGDDATQVRAVIAVGAFARTATEIAAVLHDGGLELADGLEVALWGRLDPNPTFGRMRLLAEGVDARATIGAAVVARDQVVAALTASGELDAQRTLVVPAIITRIGLISSAAAAGRADVLAGLGRSPVPVQVVEAPAAMAGPQARDAVVQALTRLAAANVDVIVVARGGGARSDLAAWDSTELARAIARCPTAVWVALGHASDRTVADLAANQSHSTPSAAAAAVVASIESEIQRQAQVAAAHHHQVQLADARRRYAVVAAVLVAMVVAAVLWWSGAR